MTPEQTQSLLAFQTTNDTRTNTKSPCFSEQSVSTSPKCDVALSALLTIMERLLICLTPPNVSFSLPISHVKTYWHAPFFLSAFLFTAKRYTDYSDGKKLLRTEEAFAYSHKTHTTYTRVFSAISHISASTSQKQHKVLEKHHDDKSL